MPQNTQWFLWEDLGLDLYKNIDKGLYELEKKQYEYELTGQGQASINDVVNPILAEEGIQCDIRSSDDIEKLIWNGTENHVAFILDRCGQNNEVVPARLVESVTNQMKYVKNAFSARAIDKSQRTYEIARIWLYSDGNLENSPFDLIYDLQEIDKIIFGEELEYNGVPYDKSADEELDDHLNGVNDEEDEEDETTGTWEVVDDTPTGTGEIDEDHTVLIPEIGDHDYVCIPDNPSELDLDDITEIIDEIEWTWSVYTPVTHTWTYTGWVVTNLASWGWPFPAMWPEWTYTDVKDSWKCSEFFCIIIEFQKSTYGLAGWETRSIQKVLSKVAEHLEKPANASLTQRKMTTNNFEIWSIIKNLPDMLRGFWIEVQSKPIPILELEEYNEEVLEWDIYELENMIRSYYKNSWLDYDRRNDLDIFGRDAEEQKAFETARGMPITYPEERIKELQDFSVALEENNRILSQSVDKKLLQDAMWDFADQFTELEKFVAAMKDFVEAISGIVWEMNKIPARSS